MVMFLLKREDPSYRESYNVHNTSTPTDYVIDLALPADGEAHEDRRVDDARGAGADPGRKIEDKVPSAPQQTE